jgi:hypothetical protein
MLRELSLEQRKQTAAIAFGVVGLVAATGGYVAFSITRMLFTILRGSYSEARRSIFSITAKINGDDPGEANQQLLPAHDLLLSYMLLLATSLSSASCLLCTHHCGRSSVQQCWLCHDW